MLLTSAPVAANGIATIALPLDLHVLSLSLAFILSQDQTLRCCIIVFLSCKRYNENATAIRSCVPAAHTRSRGPRLGSAVLVSYLSCRNLDVDSGFPFLVSALSIFLIANISMISLLTPKKGVKKIAHAICHIVSRKAMQNYNRSGN